jgi:hypothetical protein
MITGLPAFAGNDEPDDSVINSNATIGLTVCLLNRSIAVLARLAVRTALAV